jgi:hypothetical protein
MPGVDPAATKQFTPALPVSEINTIADGEAILHIPGQPLFVIDRKPWWEMPYLARQSHHSTGIKRGPRQVKENSRDLTI